ncbi:MAG: aminopeptidase P family N-terminal domain-containing protein, partial [Alphaproteobacteria bacterium]|nr:aminopeptidase P family N-terminal domain-containing protein [Alphaproteobacteria bacterium]
MNKLKDLREFMQQQGLSALLIPHTDAFQGEYIAPHCERLKWLTGFTGSAGFAVVGKEKAAFFTDGRYILQAKEEVSITYEHYNIIEKSPVQWVSENLSAQEKIGFDPWLFTEAQLKRYTSILVALEENPIDTLWTDRPEPPKDFIRLHPLKYTGESDESKRKRICAPLKTDHVLITSCDSIAWLLNIRGNDLPFTPIVHSMCVLHKDGSYDLFVDLEKINGEVFNHLHQGRGRAIDIRFLLHHLQRLEGTCQVDPQTAPFILLQTLGEKVVRGQDPCVLPKALKNEVEIKGA